MTSFWLIRHASSAAPSDQLAGWAPGVHLSERGENEVQLLAARLTATDQIAQVYTSPLERTRETAEPLAAAVGCDVIALDDLGELPFGNWAQRPFAQLEQEPDWRRFNTFRSGACLPGGSSFLGVQARAVEALLRLRALHTQQSVIVVSHADVIKAIVMHFLSIPIDLCQRLTIAPASITRLELTQDYAQLLCLNDTAHLSVTSRQGVVVASERTMHRPAHGEHTTAPELHAWGKR